MNKLLIHHGSNEIVERPQFGKGKTYNDYGQGFYCTENIELAKEWASTSQGKGYANSYELILDDLVTLELSSSRYIILHWLALLLDNRNVNLSTPTMKKGAIWIKDKFLIDISSYDIIIGYRADDSYFSFARAFLNNEISINQLNYAMRLGKPGEQVVIKSRKAFENLNYLGYCIINSDEYYAKRMERDRKARADYALEIEKDDINGLFIRDIIREEMSENDPRIQRSLFK